jgi:CheY-like chemotaxis protein
MVRQTAEIMHIPLSQYTVKQLHERAAELREMAATARTAADILSLQALSKRFDELAERREGEQHRSHRTADALTSQYSPTAQQPETERHTIPRHVERPTGPPSSRALAMATDAICHHFVLQETRQHPSVQSAAVRLAHLLIAYGLSEPLPATVVSTSKKAEMADGPESAQKHILVVDDVADVLVTVRAFLVNAGFTVEKATSGDEALRRIAANPQISILVTDFAMPGLSGVDLITHAKQVRPNIKALVITGYPNADGLAELPPHTSILVKPFRRANLIAEVQSLLGEIPVPSETTR